MASYAVYKALRVFGTIEYISEVRNGFKFTMAHTRSVKRLKPSYKLDVNGIKLPVKHLQEILIKQQRPRNIKNSTTLNDDCLFEVFKHLDLVDMPAVKLTCKRFNNLANEVIRKKLKHQMSPAFNTEQHMRSEMWHLENQLKAYGDMMTEVAVDNHDHASRVIIGMVQEYCPNVEVLACYVSSNEYGWHAFRGFFCVNYTITTMKICGRDSHVTMPQVTLPYLTGLSVSNVRLFNEPPSDMFFQINNRIQSLTIDESAVETNVAISPLRHLRELRVLSMGTHSIRFIKRFVKMLNMLGAPLETLDLFRLRHDQREIDIYNIIHNCDDLREFRLRELTKTRLSLDNIKKTLQAMDQLDRISVDEYLTGRPRLLFEVAAEDDVTRLFAVYVFDGYDNFRR